MELKPEEKTIYQLELIKFTPPDISLSIWKNTVFIQLKGVHSRIGIECSSGTYIRKLVHDIGIANKTYAYCKALKRTKQGPFRLSDSLREGEWTAPRLIQALRDAKGKVNKYFDKQNVPVD